jgi:hypothetical protein
LGKGGAYGAERGVKRREEVGAWGGGGAPSYGGGRITNSTGMMSFIALMGLLKGLLKVYSCISLGDCHWCGPLCDSVGGERWGVGAVEWTYYSHVYGMCL